MEMIGWSVELRNVFFKYIRSDTISLLHKLNENKVWTLNKWIVKKSLTTRFIAQLYRFVWSPSRYLTIIAIIFCHICHIYTRREIRKENFLVFHVKFISFLVFVWLLHTVKQTGHVLPIQSSVTNFAVACLLGVVKMKIYKKVFEVI